VVSIVLTSFVGSNSVGNMTTCKCFCLQTRQVLIVEHTNYIVHKITQGSINRFKTKFIRGYLMSYNIYYIIYHSINLCKCMHCKTLLANNCFIRRICTSFHDFIFKITQITIHFIHIKLL
jgi:hypothetical protein